MLLILEMRERMQESMSERFLDAGKDEETECPLNLLGMNIA